MIKVHALVFSPFMENTYVLEDASSNTCVIIDPGCYGTAEENRLAAWLESNKLRPVALWFTHGHLDHVFGSGFVAHAYGLTPRIHALEIPIIESMPAIATHYGLRAKLLPEFQYDLNEGDELEFGGNTIQLIHVPGHSPGSICFYSEKDNWLIAGDTVFMESIGRTDLPLGNHQQLLSSIKAKLWVLPDATVIYPGHGPSTSIGYEKVHNPFLT